MGAWDAIFAGVGTGIGGAGQAIAAARKDAEDRAHREALANEQLIEQRRHNIATEGAQKTNVGALFKTLGLPLPEGAEAGEMPNATAAALLDKAQKSAEVQRGLAQGRTVADDLTNQYGRVVPLPGDEQPGPIRPVVDDPYLRTILSTVRTTGLTDKTAPQVENYGKFRAEIAEKDREYQRGQDTLRAMGILPPKAGATDAATSPSGGTLQWLPRVDAKGGVSVHATAPTDETDRVAIEKYGTLFRNLDETKRADVAKTIQERKVQVSREQGAGGVTAKAAAEAGLPLYQSKKEGQHVVDLKADAEVDYFATKGADLEKNSKNYKLLNGDQYKQWVAIKEMEGIFSEFERIAPQLVKQPGLNKLQQIEMWAKTNLGVPGIQTDLEALKGATLRVARAMQGSAQNLSDADRKTVEGMLPTSADTADSALRKLTQAYRVFGHMKAAVLGQSRASERAREAVGETGTVPPPGFRRAK